LDSYISPIPRFEGDILVPVILVSVRSPSGESASYPSARVSAGASSTRVGKYKPSATLTPIKKAKKVSGQINWWDQDQ
jgi:hypothetical protein